MTINKMVFQAALLAGLFTSNSFADAHYHGDISKVVRGIAKDRHLLLKPAIGKAFYVPVDIDQPGDPETEELLSIVGTKAGANADVIYDAQDQSVQIQYLSEPGKPTGSIEGALYRTSVPYQDHDPYQQEGLPIRYASYSTSELVKKKKTKKDARLETLAEAKRWQSGQRAAPLYGNGGLVKYPVDESQPTIVCKPLYTCDIELPPGETINDIAVGDTVRWLVAPMHSAAKGKQIQHVIVKPTESDIESNLIITTSERTYMLTLQASDTGYISRIGFYDPGAMAQSWKNASQDMDSSQIAAADGAAVCRNEIHAYKVDGDNGVPWFPVRAFDDGTHVCIQMPAEMETSDAPAFYEIGDNDDLQLVNYRVKGNFYVVDKTFEKGALVLGVGGDRKQVNILKKSGWWFS